MLEYSVEGRLKKLERKGFKVLKLRTPGCNGVMDRMILWPKYSPKPPTFVEIKRPGQDLRALQLATALDWKARGCDVREPCDTYEDIDALVETMIGELDHEQ